jgi:ribosome-associated protein
MPTQNSMLDKLLQLLDDHQAIDVKVIDVRQQTAITDYMIISSGRSSRQVKAIAQKIMEDMKASGHPALHCTGLEGGDWVLIDFSDFVIHVMQPEVRDYYNLEGLWEERSENKN